MSKPPSTDYIDKDGFRANVGIVLTRASREVFLGGRVGGRGWQFPQGGVNRGERVEEALFRELKEEIGLERRDVEVLGSTRGWLRYRLPRQYVRDRCIGQKQRWFLLRLIGDESKLRFDSTATRSSIAGAGPIIGRRCARSCISSGGSTCGRCTTWAS
jgi:putative (di)nucleoside polyphosphate hydrolase